MTVWTRSAAIAAVMLMLLAPRAIAQNAPPPAWTGALAAGLAMTGGNTTTTTTNVAFNIESDKTKQNVFRAEMLNLRSSRDGDAIVDRTLVSAQDDYALTDRTYTFGRFQYVRDVFKSIDYLVAPTAGIGYKVINTPETTLNADVAAGLLVEKNPGLERRTGVGVTATERASHRISSAATLTQSLSSIWRVSDLGDVLVSFQAGLATDITPRTQLKVDFLDSYDSQPPNVLVKKNDTAIIVSFVLKF